MARSKKKTQKSTGVKRKWRVEIVASFLVANKDAIYEQGMGLGSVREQINDMAREHYPGLKIVSRDMPDAQHHTGIYPRYLQDNTGRCTATAKVWWRAVYIARENREAINGRSREYVRRFIYANSATGRRRRGLLFHPAVISESIATTAGVELGPLKTFVWPEACKPIADTTPNTESKPCSRP